MDEVAQNERETKGRNDEREPSNPGPPENDRRRAEAHGQHQRAEPDPAEHDCAEGGEQIGDGVIRPIGVAVQRHVVVRRQKRKLPRGCGQHEQRDQHSNRNEGSEYLEPHQVGDRLANRRPGHQPAGA